MSREAIDRAVALGVCLDIQPAWLYLDTRTLDAQFGYERLRYFQPLRSIFAAGGIAGGGSDHMQKIGAMRSINPYHPFWGMWVTLTRGARWYDRPLHPEEALDRQQAITFYTRNNAYIMRMEDQLGSLEVGQAGRPDRTRSRPADLPRRRNQGHAGAWPPTWVAEKSKFGRQRRECDGTNSAHVFDWT